MKASPPHGNPLLLFWGFLCAASAAPHCPLPSTSWASPLTRPPIRGMLQHGTLHNRTPPPPAILHSSQPRAQPVFPRVPAETWESQLSPLLFCLRIQTVIRWVHQYGMCPIPCLPPSPPGYHSSPSFTELDPQLASCLSSGCHTNRPQSGRLKQQTYFLKVVEARSYR